MPWLRVHIKRNFVYNFFVRAKKQWSSSLCNVNPDPYWDSLVPYTCVDL